MAAKIVSRGDPIEPIYLNNLRVASQGWGYTSGLGVTQKGAGANMSVDVAAGGAYVNGTTVTKGSITNVVITAAHATYDRYDLIVINSSGTISVVDGTAAAVSYANDYDLEANNSVLLSEVYVPATDTTIETAQCIDKRIISSANTVHPSGLISMWHGLIANIPSGWVLCDGTNSTPDLREKFVRGAPAATEAGTTGGADTHNHDFNVNDGNCYVSKGGTSPTYDSFLVNGDAVSVHPIPTNAASTLPAYFAVLYIMKT